MTSLTVRRLSARVGPFGLGPLDLEVPGGHLLSILGRTGAGKSALLLVLAGFVASAAGSASIDGSDLLTLAPEKRHVGLVLSGTTLFPHLDVRANVAFGARRRPDVFWEDRVRRALALVDATDLAPRHPTELTASERIRVALARALASDPALLLFDDPLRDAEPADRPALLDTICRAVTQVGVAAVYATRDVSDVAAIGGDVMLLRAGAPVQTGPVETVLAYPVDPPAARLCGFENILPGRVLGPSLDGLALAVGHGVLALPGAVDLARDTRVTVATRARWVAVAPGQGGGPNRLAGRVERITYTGSAWRLYLDCGVRLVAEAMAADLPPHPAGLPPQPGDPVTAVLRATSIRLWSGAPGSPS